MDIRYRWERNETYMLVNAGQTDPEYYQVKMLENNRVHGLIKVRLQQINQSSEFCYTISGRQTMIQKFGNTYISVGHIRQLMAALNQTAGELETYLLDMDNLLLNPAFIFWRDEDVPPEFCYYPEEKPERPFRENLKTLFQYLLNKTDHNDMFSVTVVYGLYQISVKETFRLQDCMQFLFYDAEQQQAGIGTENEKSFCRTVEETDNPGEMIWGSQRKMSGRKPTEKQRSAGMREETTDREMSVKRQAAESGKVHVWLDWLLVLVILGLAVVAVWKVLSGWYERWGNDSETKGVVICVAMVAFILAISAGAIYRLCYRHTGSGREKVRGGEMKLTEENPEIKRESINTDKRMSDDEENGSSEKIWSDSLWTGESRPERICPDEMWPSEAAGWAMTGDLAGKTDRRWPGHICTQSRPVPGDGATGVLTGCSVALRAEGSDKSSGAGGGFWFRYQGEKMIKDFFLGKETTQVFIGKDLMSPDIGLGWSTISRRHAVLRVHNGICTIQDCGSTNGTYLDDVRLQEGWSRILLPGAEVRFADLAFRMEPSGEENDGTQVLRCDTDFGKIV